MAALSVGVLSGCAATGPSGLSVHEALVYGGGQQRLAWVYGDLTPGKEAQVSIEGQPVRLTGPGQAGGALLVNGSSTYRGTLDTAVNQPKVVRNARGLFDVSSAGGITELYYTDGRSWLRLNATAGSGISARPASGLQGAGDLTDSEAAALSQALSGQGALAVGVLSPSSIPDRRLSVEPQPQEHRLTALSVARVEGAAAPSPAPTTPARPGTTQPGGTVNYSVLDQGNNAAASGPTVQVATTAAQAEALYALAYGRQSSRPSAPSVTGRTLVGIFMGTRATGGYSLEVRSVSMNGGQATVEVREKTPPVEALTTQALTSPWIIVQLDGRFSDVQVQGLGRSAGISGSER